MTREIRVSCDMIIEQEGRVLMGQRGNVFGQGSWALPGGHLESNEKIIHCMKRELDEETGIMPVRFELLGVVNDLPDVETGNPQYVRFIYLVHEFSGEVTNKEPEKCLGWEWFDKDKLPEPVFTGHKNVLKLYLSEQKGFLLE